MRPTRMISKKISLLTFLFTLYSGLMFAQQPTHSAGSKNEAIDLTNWFDIVIFILFPIIIIAVYFAWRKKVSDEKKEKNKNTQND